MGGGDKFSSSSYLRSWARPLQFSNLSLRIVSEQRWQCGVTQVYCVTRYQQTDRNQLILHALYARWYLNLIRHFRRRYTRCVIKLWCESGFKNVALVVIKICSNAFATSAVSSTRALSAPTPRMSDEPRLGKILNSLNWINGWKTLVECELGSVYMIGLCIN